LIGTHDLKGFAQPVQAWLVMGESRAEGRFEALHGMLAAEDEILTRIGKLPKRRALGIREKLKETT
jgi:hypothetical protein